MALLVSTICDDYINTIGEHAYDPYCEDPEFVFKSFSESGTHSLYPRQIHRAYRPYRLARCKNCHRRTS